MINTKVTFRTIENDKTEVEMNNFDGATILSSGTFTFPSLAIAKLWIEGLEDEDGMHSNEIKIVEKVFQKYEGNELVSQVR